MTADNLRAIAARHADMQRGADYYPHWWVEQTGRYDMERAHADRSALLALVRRVAEMDPFDDCGVCWCGEASPDHTPDCLWLLCQGVRE